MEALQRNHIRKLLNYSNSPLERITLKNINKSEDGNGNLQNSCNCKVETIQSSSAHSTLSSQDSEVNFKDADGNTPLHLAINQKNEQRVKELLLAGADLNAQNGKRESPLYRAAKGQDKEVCLRLIKLLIDHGADVFATDYINKTFLHILLRENPQLTPLQFHDLAGYLVGKMHTQLFNTPSFLSITPFQFAVYRLEVMEATLSLLQRNGVNFNAADELGRSVLFWAVNGKRSPKFLSQLIQLGADWKHRNNVKRNFLHQAANWDNVDALKFFLMRGGLQVNAVDSEGDTPLIYAIRRGRENVLQMTRLLIENEADVNISDKLGNTPVALALRNNYIEDADRDELVKLLGNTSN